MKHVSPSLRTCAFLSALSAGLIVAACGIDDGSTLMSDDDDDDTSTSTSTSSSSTTGGGGFDPGDAGTGATDTCNSGPNEDYDEDGFTGAEGDCNDCDENANPGAVEVMTDPNDPEANPADEDCDGEIDELPVPCDGNLDIASVDPMHGANAIDLCQTTTAAEKTWGVINAQYVRANGGTTSPGLAVGIIDTFGPNVPPRAGARVLGLSSGYARTPSQPNPCGALSCSTSGTGQAPPGFPQDVPGCSGSQDINDDVALELELRAPTNATGYSFDFTFYSFEYPEWVCTSFNDQFIALVNPAPEGSVNGNISFDSQTNPVSVNIAFFEVCDGCPLGIAELSGTGFDVWDDAGATGWLITQAPVEGGEVVTIRFAIWDTGDSAWDSTVLVDNFQWIADAGTVTVGTVPVPN